MAAILPSVGTLLGAALGTDGVWVTGKVCALHLIPLF